MYIYIYTPILVFQPFYHCNHNNSYLQFDRSHTTPLILHKLHHYFYKMCLLLLLIPCSHTLQLHDKKDRNYKHYHLQNIFDMHHTHTELNFLPRHIYTHLDNPYKHHYHSQRSTFLKMNYICFQPYVLI